MPRKTIRLDKELWSEKSKGGVEYAIAGAFYEDKPFLCRACGKEGRFSAEQQKYTYEVRKALIYQEHVLCEACFKERNKLEAESAKYLAEWDVRKAALTRNKRTLQRWKEILETLPVYGARKDTARIRMLARLIANAG